MYSDGLNLAGVAIGNGVMDMYFQEPSYAEYAYYHGLIPLGAKQKFERDWASCMELVRVHVVLTGILRTIHVACSANFQPQTGLHFHSPVPDFVMFSCLDVG